MYPWVYAQMAATMPVEARCSSCNDVHPVGDRPRLRGTTACPACGSTSYQSESVDGEIRKPEADRIRDACKDVQGVGQQNLAAIVATFDHYPAFEAAGADELAQVEGVGPKTATRIVEDRDG